MDINCIVDVASREVSFQENYRIAAYDHNVDVIHFSVEPIEDFSLNTSSIKIAAQGPNNVRHDYAVDPSTVAIEEETGYITFDWPIPAGVTEMPIGTFKYGDKGRLIFAVCAEIISGDTVSKAWHSDDGIITVVAHLEPESGGGEDPEEEATNAQKIGQLQADVAVINTQVGALANGSPTPVSTVAEMTDESAVYLYTGSETGYTAGNWYFWNGSAWTSGGTYGGAVTDTTLSISGVPADAKKTGDEISELKADLYENEIFNKSDWENGGISASTGANANNSSRIRTKSFLPWGVTRLYSTNSNVRFLVYAYNSSGTYVGGWWGDGTFNPTDVKGVSSVDFNSIYSNPAYSGYKLKVAIYISNGTARVETISDVYIDSLPVVDFIKRSANLTLERVEKIPNNTDFDSLMSAGNYYVENYASISTMLNTPPEAAQGGRLWVGYGISKSRPYQVWLSFNSLYEPYFYMRVYNGSSWEKWNYIGEPQPVHMRVLGYNIGKFNWGQDGGLSTNVDTKIANYKSFFGKVNPDAVLLAEFTQYIDSGESYDSVSTVFSPLFRKKTQFNQCAVFSNYNLKKLNNDEGIYLRDNNNTYAGQVSQAVCSVNNRSLCLCGGFLRVLGTAQERYEAFANLLASLSVYDYAVVYLDTNVLDETERQSIYTAATTAGFTVANGGYFGLKDTLVPTDMFKPIDNIFVKGNVKLKNFYVASDEYDNLSSDHIPVVVDLTLY